MNTIKKIFCILSFLFIAFTLQAQEANFVPGQLLIKLKDSAKAQKTSLSSQMKATTVKNYTTLGIELWELNQANGKQATLELIEQFKNHPDVEFVEPNYLWEAIGGTEPNDPYFPQLWGLHNTGQNGGTEDADIDAPEAYCMPISAIDVVVGIVDTGIDYTHEDLAENMWQNLGEDANGNGKVLIQSGNTWIFDPGDENGIDDDGNGYVDDFVGWDFVYKDNDPMDLHSHGTHCAGTIGAVTNNNTGINGVASNVKLAALKFLGDNGFGSTCDAAEAINYAIAMGISITNNSWGGGPFSATLYQAIQSAEANNHLFIAAAGNKNLDNDQHPHYPSSYDNANIISVASTDRNDNRSDFSNFGATSVDIGAPGSQIYSCIPGNGYGHKSGTSMATPHIAGVCAFVWGANPSSNYNTIKNALMNADNNLPALSGKCVSGGRVNLHDALIEMGAPPNPCDAPEPPAVCNRNTDSLALVALYHSISNVTTSTNWDLQNSIEDWGGVQLDNEGCVRSLEIYPYYDIPIVGNIPPEIGNFSRLKYLRIETDDFSGPIPAEIGNLTTLEELYVRINNNNGLIPEEIYQLNKLKSLILRGPFTGSISSNIGNLVALENLEISAGFDTNHLGSLTGVIPSEIGNLTQLKRLTFSYQNFSGGLPASFSNLVNLESLFLRDNNLSGNINWLGDLVSLEEIEILSNQFSGSIPPSIGNLQNIKYLGFGLNQLTGEIPVEICNCFSLESISIIANQLSGIIPNCIGQLSNLNTLNLSANQITGNIPEEIGFLSELSNLDLGNNQLQGSLPATFGNLDKLKSFSVINNNLSGCFSNQLSSLCRDSLNLENPPWPPEYNHFNEGNNFDADWEDFCESGAGSCAPPPICNRNTDSLALVALYHSISNVTTSTNWDLQNSIEDWGGVQLDKEGCVRSLEIYPYYDIPIVGNIPPEIGNFSRLKYLRIETDDFSGPIPAEIGNLTTLEELYVRINNNNGLIPEEIYQLNKLKSLILRGPFTGSISSNIGNLVALENLEISAGFDTNHLGSLTGVIPSEIGNLTQLKRLTFSYQNFSGGLPASFSNLVNLESLFLRDNNLSGNINWLGDLVSLEEIEILSNQFSGSIPPSIGNLQNIKYLGFGLNQLTGEIPVEICNCFSLESISIIANQLSGIIPNCIGQLSNLNTLNLSANQITGNIPEEIGFLSELSNLDLGNNQLQGSLPATFGNLDKLKSFSVINNNLSGCFSNQLSSLCRDSLNLENPPWPPEYNHFNEGNNFDADWEDFCATGTGSCDPLISQVWPGDFDNNGVAEINDLLYWGIANGNTGVTRPNATTNWEGQDCENWTTEVNGVNSNHQDGDGNGVVNVQDLLVLIQNIGETHSYTAPNNLTSSYKMEVLPNGVSNGTSGDVAFEYLLKVSNNGNPIIAHGICASMFFGNLKVSDAYANLSGSSLQPQEYRENFNAATNAYEICLTRNDGINQPVIDLARIIVQVNDEPDDGVLFALNINSGSVIQANGTLDQVAGSTTLDTYYSDHINDSFIALSTSTSHAICENGGSALVNALGGSGNYCYQWNTGASTQQITNLSPGMYSVLVCDDNGVANSIEVEVQGQFIPVYDDNGEIIPCNTFATCPTVIDFEGYMPDGTHQAKSAIHTKADLENGYNVELKASNLIRLTSGFSTRGSQSFKVRMENCE